MKIRKPFYAILIMLVLASVYAGLVAVVSYKTVDDRESERMQLQIENVGKMLEMMENEFKAAYDHFMTKSMNVTTAMAAMLSEYIEYGQYKGPAVFEDGFVAEVRNGKVIFPEGLENFPEIDAETLVNNQSGQEYEISIEEDGEEVLLTVKTAPISGNYYYIDLVSFSNIMDSIIRSIRLEKTLSDIEKFYNCRILIVSIPPSIRKNDVRKYTPAGDFYEFIYNSGLEDLDGVDPGDHGITKEILSQQPSVLEFEGGRFKSTFREVNFLGEYDMAIILNPMDNNLQYMYNSVVLAVSLTLITGIAVIMGLYWYQAYVRDNELSPEQAAACRPAQVRKYAYSVALIGSIVMFILIIFYQSLGSLYHEANSNRVALETIMKRLVEDENDFSAAEETEEAWGIYALERIADVMKDKENFQTVEFLEKINDIIGSEYLMLFDHEGKEIAASNGVVGYSLTESENLKVFQEQMKGLNTQVLDPDADPWAVKITQLFGTPVRFEKDNGYGVLIASIDAGNTWQKTNKRSFRTFLENMTPENDLCLAINKTDNLVAYSSSEKYLSESIPDLAYKEGAPEDSDLDTYTVDNKHYYGTYDTIEKFVVYYLTEASLVQQCSFTFVFVCAVGFLIIIFLISRFMLRSYTREAFNSALRIKEDIRAGEMLDMNSLDEFFGKSDDDAPVNMMDRWRALIPAQKIQLFLQVFLGLLLLGFILLNLPTDRNIRTHLKTIDFIFYGNWKRGLNLLGLSGSLLVVIAFGIFIFFKDILLKALCSVLDAKGETICRLAFSLLQYMAVLGGIYLIMGFLGMNTTFQLTSVGIISLAISLGSKDIVADILAGIFIIFEGDFHVGDFVDINGFQGIVQEIGVRSTKVLGLGDNVKIIGNQSIQNVLNMSKMNTWLTLEFRIPPDCKLTEVEKLLEAELPEIGKRIPEIICGPLYKGVWAIEMGKKVLHISCECQECHSRRVRRKLNHEVIVLLESNGFTLM